MTTEGQISKPLPAGRMLAITAGAFILGSLIVFGAIHVGSWLGPARRFIHSNAAALKAKPVWAFSVGMPAQEADRVNEELMMDGKIRKVVPDLRGHKLFQGRFYQQDLGWFLGLIFKCCVPREKATCAHL